MKYLFIFPNKNQLNIIEQYIDLLKNDILIVPNRVKPKFEANIYEEYKIENEKEIKVLCCHEEGIYWLKNNSRENMKMSFSYECFSMNNKWNSYILFNKNNIPCVYKTKERNEINDFPIVAKPNIGFGSIGVKRIDNSEELKKYLDNFSEMMKNSIVEEDRNKYFKEEENFPIFEKCVDNGQFFSVPFVFDGKNIYIYPVMGVRKENTLISNYKWTTFLYGKESIDNECLIKMKKIVTQITNSWITGPSVNLVEMIYDYDEQEFKVLEFSPRIVGGRISKMIKYALGIDLEKDSIKSFLNDILIDLNEKSNKISLVDICNVDKEGNEFDSYDQEKLINYNLIDVEETKSPIGENKIRYKIYVKEGK